MQLLEVLHIHPGNISNVTRSDAGGTGADSTVDKEVQKIVDDCVHHFCLWHWTSATGHWTGDIGRSRNAT